MKLLLVLLLMLVVAVFCVQNAGMITVRFLQWEFAMSQALVIIVAAVCGALVGVIVGAVSARPKPARSVDAPAPPKKL